MIAFTRRTMLGGALVFASGCSSAKAATIMVYRDPDCGCCEDWTRQLKAHFQRSVEVVNSPDRRPVQQQAAMPADLASCHTAVIDGLVVEGHVPMADIDRLLAQHPASGMGLAVPGMPLGSPGMETSPPQHESYDVMAFGLTVTPYVFAHHD